MRQMKKSYRQRLRSDRYRLTIGKPVVRRFLCVWRVVWRRDWEWSEGESTGAGGEGEHGQSSLKMR